jgi:hypothetical protein
LKEPESSHKKIRRFVAWAKGISIRGKNFAFEVEEVYQREQRWHGVVLEIASRVLMAVLALSKRDLSRTLMLWLWQSDR